MGGVDGDGVDTDQTDLIDAFLADLDLGEDDNIPEGTPQREAASSDGTGADQDDWADSLLREIDASGSGDAPSQEVNGQNGSGGGGGDIKESESKGVVFEGSGGGQGVLKADQRPDTESASKMAAVDVETSPAEGSGVAPTNKAAAAAPVASPDTSTTDASPPETTASNSVTRSPHLRASSTQSLISIGSDNDFDRDLRSALARTSATEPAPDGTVRGGSDGIFDPTPDNVVLGALRAVDAMAAVIKRDRESAARETARSAEAFQAEALRLRSEAEAHRAACLATRAQRKRKEDRLASANAGLEREKSDNLALQRQVSSAQNRIQALRRSVMSLHERASDPPHRFVPAPPPRPGPAGRPGGRPAAPHSSTSGWVEFPASVLERVFMCLTVRDVVSAEGVCRDWMRVIGHTRIIKKLLQRRHAGQVARARAASSEEAKEASRKPPRPAYENHYVLDLGVGAGNTYIVKIIKQPIPLRQLVEGVSGAAMAAAAALPRAQENGGSSDAGATNGPSVPAPAAPQIAMKPIVQRNKETRSVKIMFTDRNSGALRQEMSFVNKAVKTHVELSAVRKRVLALRDEARRDTGPAMQFFRSQITSVSSATRRVQETISTIKSQLSSDLTTREFLSSTLGATEQSYRALRAANAKTRANAEREMKRKEAELKEAETAKVGDRKKLDELNRHIRVLAKNAKDLKANIDKLQAQRDLMRSNLSASLRAAQRGQTL